MKTACWMMAALCIVTIEAMAADRGSPPTTATNASAGVSIEAASRAQGGEIAAIRKRIMKQVRALADQKISRSRSPEDKLIGLVTFSIPDGEAREYPFVAYIYLKWGDLDNVIKKGGKRFYSEWNGHVKVHGGELVSIIKEFAFEDKGRGTPGPGSPRDEVAKEENPSLAAWESGVVGSTDGLLFRLSLHEPVAAGEIRAGPFTIPFAVRSRPASSPGTGNIPQGNGD